MDRRPSVGVGVVVVNDGKVLLGRRKGAHGAGDWSFAGGHLEYGEDVEECAKRELLEETGLRALSMTMGPWINGMIEDKHYVTLFVFVSEFAGEVQLLEPKKCEGWHWFTWEEIPQPLFPPVASLIQMMGLEKLAEISAKPMQMIF